MAYNYYMPIGACSYCPYIMEEYQEQIPETEGVRHDEVKRIGDKEIVYDSSEYRLLPLLTIPLLFGAFAPRPPIYGPRPYWGPPPYFYNYWYYYR